MCIAMSYRQAQLPPSSEGAAASYSTAAREHLNIISPDAGKRYKLYLKGAVYRLSVGKVKSCLASASSCPIPRERMVLKLNGVPLSNDADLCGSLGILTGATLSVEERGRNANHTRSSRSRHDDESQDGLLHSNNTNDSGHISDDADGDGDANGDADADLLGLLVNSPQRRLLELQTLEEQERFVRDDSRARDGALGESLARLDDAFDRTGRRRAALERQRQAADAALRVVSHQEAEAARERRRLAELRAAEEATAAARSAELSARREELREEQSHIRRVAQLKLDNEKRKAALESQRAAREAESRRARAAEQTLEEADRRRQLSIRSREVEQEHDALRLMRARRALLADKAAAIEERERQYEAMGLAPPPGLARERRQLLLQQDTNADPFNNSHNSNGGRRASPSSHASVPRLTSGADPLIPNNDNKGGGMSSRSATSQDPLHVPSLPDGYYYDPAENAAENLLRLGDDLGLNPAAGPLTFDEAHTCVISVDGEYTLLVTYDAATERLFLYSTLLTAVPGGEVNNPNSSKNSGAVAATTTTAASPEAAALRLKLYEYLLEGAVLGRDMCGGGIGASLKNDFILMSTSLYMPTSQPWALRTVAPQFLQCLCHWRERVADFIESYHQQQEQQVVVGGGGGYPQQQLISGGFPSAHTINTFNNSSSAPLYRAASSGNGHHSCPHDELRQPSRDGSLLFSREDFTANSNHSISIQQQQPSSYRHGNGNNTNDGYRQAPVIGLEVAGSSFQNSGGGGSVVVLAVAGPAALAGIEPQDTIAALNGAPLRTIRDFEFAVGRLAVGQVVSVDLVRGGRPLTVNMQVGSVWVPSS